MNDRKVTIYFFSFLISLVLFIYWFFWGRILQIDISRTPIDTIVNVSCFEHLKPSLKRSQIFNTLGVPDYRIANKEESGTVCTYNRPDGSLIYYAPEDDSSDGSLTFIPKNKNVNEFMLLPLSLILKNEIKLTSSDTTLLTIDFKLFTHKVNKISYYN